MSSILARLRPPHASRTSRKRKGRGVGSGLGKTCGRGQKGQTSRAGKSHGLARGFEGGQMPIQRRMPKRGFINPFRRELEVVNLRDLAKFEKGEVVGPAEFEARRLVRSAKNGVKVLAVGELPHALTVKAHAFSAAARRKIEAAGGTVEVLAPTARAVVVEQTEASGS